MPELADVYRRFSPQGLVVLGVTYEETGLVRRFTAQHPVAYPILLDPRKVTEKPFNVTGFPGNVVFGREGNRVASWNDRPSHQRMTEMLKTAGLHE
jgi:peroxiredoxin